MADLRCDFVGMHTPGRGGVVRETCPDVRGSIPVSAP